jgi:hypothetical protein
MQTSSSPTRDCSSTAERAVKNELTGRMRIAILDDYKNVATRFADWDSLDADVLVFTRAPSLPSRREWIMS